VDQSEPLYHGLGNRACLSPPKLIVPGEARPLKIALEAIYTSSLMLAASANSSEAQNPYMMQRTRHR